MRDERRFLVLRVQHGHADICLLRIVYGCTRIHGWTTNGTLQTLHSYLLKRRSLQCLRSQEPVEVSLRDIMTGGANFKFAS